MKRILAFLFLSFASPALAANVNIDALPAAGSVGGTDLLECEQGGINRKCTAAQTAAYVNSLFSGDFTAAAGGAATFATVNGNVGTFGSATNCVTVTVNAKGLVTAASQATCTPAMSSVTGRASLAQLPQGIANSIWINPTGSTADMQNVAVPACANDGLHALVYVNASGLACATLTAGGVTSIAGNTGAFTLDATSGLGNATNAINCKQSTSSQFGCVKPDGTTITASGGVFSTAALTVTTSVQAGANYAFLTGDQAKVVYLNNGSAQVPTVAQAGTAGFAAGWFVTACNIAAGQQTITPATSTIGGALNYVLPPASVASPKCVTFISDGTNYVVVPSGNTYTIAAGTSALGTSAISSATCATVVTTSAPGVLTTDVPTASFNGDPTAVTGYIPLVAGMLTIIGYPTANNVNWKVCNNTNASVTPGAITLNWRVAR